jgi:putative addiction module CopG family antidote
MIQVPIPVEFEPFVRDVVANGNYENAEHVVGEALRLLARREQLLRDVAAGVEQLDRGEYSEDGEDERAIFLADIEAEERLRFPNGENEP